MDTASHRRVAIAILLLMFLSPLLSEAANLALSSRFGHHMVLQRDRPIPIAGSAAPGAGIRILIGDNRAAATADERGHWRVVLPAMEGGGPYTLRAQSEQEEILLEDVWLGEVWLGSGQSNMWMPLAEAWEARREIAAADHPKVRIFTTSWTPSLDDQSDVGGTWTVSEPAAAHRFTALGYFFATRLQRELGVAVGFINVSIGGTRAEAWIPRQALLKDGIYREILQRDADEAAKRLSEGDSPAHAGGAGHLFAGMVHPWTSFPVRGIVWYQGESNASRSYQYRSLLPNLIQSWRQAWDDPDLPFIVVQLPEFKRRAPEPVQPSEWAEMRDAQLRVVRETPHTHLAVLLGTGDARDIHPGNKRGAGHRVAQVALSEIYQGPSSSGCPQTVKMVIAGGEVHVQFSHAEGGLILREAEENEPGWALAGADRIWHPAGARIDDSDTVIVTSPAVAQPKAVRYGWADNPRPILFNARQLPASPFRSDDWPELTNERR